MSGPTVENRDRAGTLTRGLRRHLAHMGYASITEMPLSNNRRADILGISKSGRVIIVEVKSSLADFRADGKWPDYLPWCDRFYFGVAEDFPAPVLPSEQGLMVADGFGAQMIRQAPTRPMHGSRRRALLLRFARTAAARLHWTEDPNRLAEG